MNIPEGFKPMLASPPKSDADLRFPLLASPKLDGIRAVVFGGVVYSRNLKPIPNKFVQKVLGRPELEGFDGELLVGSATDEAAFRATTSGIMSSDGEPDVVFHVFDIVGHPGGFAERLKALEKRLEALPKCMNFHVEMVPHERVADAAALRAREEDWLLAGYEGAMVRSVDGPYKFGRSSAKEGYLLKIKRFCDAEALILGVEELLHNENEKTRDALGRAKRSTHKEGKRGGGTLGNLLVVMDGVHFSIGSGFTAAERDRLWAIKDKLTGELVKFRYFPTGSKEAPRFPVYLGIRHKDDA